MVVLSAEAVVAAQSTEKSARAGIRLYRREGETVKQGEMLMGVFAGSGAQTLGERVGSAVRIGQLAPQARPVVLARLHANPM